MERYSEYKDSGVKWLGEIPGHWELRKMKYTFDERSQKGFPNEPLLAATQNHGVILKSQYENRTVEAVKSLDTLKLVEIGDFVISLRSFQGGLEYAHNRGIISPAYTILTPTHIKASYFKHLSKSDIFISLLKSSVTGIREGQNIDYNKLKESLLPIPPEEEQKAMGCYLDAATSKIDKAIAMQQKMIDLLNERKQIIIQNAVTKGLDENVEMKDSGVEWIGMIPKHWKILKLKRCASIKTGTTPPTNERKYFDGGRISWFTPGDLNDLHLEFASKMITQKAIDDKVGRLFPAKTIYFVGIGATVAKVSACDFAASSNQQINAIICKESLDYRFATYVLKSEQEFIRNMANYVTLPIINQSDTGLIDMIVPPKSEQQAIVAYLDKEMEHFDSAITNCQRQIALLQERKQIIINEVVTGKVKVS